MIRSAASLIAAQRIVKAIDPEASPTLVLLAAIIIQNAVREDEIKQAEGTPDPRLVFTHGGRVDRATELARRLERVK